MGTIPDNDFIKIFKNSYSIAEIIRKCGFSSYSTSHYRHINKRINYLGLDKSHLEGIQISHNNASRKIRNHIVLSNSGIKEKSIILKKTLLKYGVEYKCLECGIDKWNGKPLKLHIDHRDGNNTNNEPNNLRFLCPNCHSQTETWGISKGYNKKKDKKLCKNCNKEISKGNISGYCFDCCIKKRKENNGESITQSNIRKIISQCNICGKDYTHYRKTTSGKCKKCRGGYNGTCSKSKTASS